MGTPNPLSRFAASYRTTRSSRLRIALGLEIAFGALLVLAAGLPALLLFDRLELLGLGLVNGQPRALAALGGLGFGLVLFTGFAQLPGFRFANSLHHELSHLAAAVVLLAQPQRLEASAAGFGSTEIALRGPLPRLRGFLVAIAPYWFSPVLGTALSAAVSLSPNIWGRFVGAAVLGWALWVLLAQVSLRQSDLTRYGVVLPLAASLWLWAAAAACGLAVLASGRYASLGSIYRTGWATLLGWLS